MTEDCCAILGPSAALIGWSAAGVWTIDWHHHCHQPSPSKNAYAIYGATKEIQYILKKNQKQNQTEEHDKMLSANLQPSSKCPKGNKWGCKRNRQMWGLIFKQIIIQRGIIPECHSNLKKTNKKTRVYQDKWVWLWPSEDRAGARASASAAGMPAVDVF